MAYAIEWLEDTKEVIRIHKSKKDIQHNGQKKKDKRPNSDLHNTTQKNKGRATHFPLKSGGELRFSKKDRPLFLNQINKSSSGPEVNECVMNEKLLTLHVKENLQ